MKVINWLLPVNYILTLILFTNQYSKLPLLILITQFKLSPSCIAIKHYQTSINDVKSFITP